MEAIGVSSFAVSCDFHADLADRQLLHTRGHLNQDSRFDRPDGHSCTPDALPNTANCFRHTRETVRPNGKSVGLAGPRKGLYEIMALAMVGRGLLQLRDTPTNTGNGPRSRPDIALQDSGEYGSEGVRNDRRRRRDSS